VKIVIIGGGYLGQLLHTLLPTARVFDWRTTAPAAESRAFGPQYLWTPIYGLPFNSFQVVTTVDGKDATPESILAYKKKVGKEQDQSDWRSQFRSVMAGYDVQLPPARVEYGMRIIGINLIARTIHLASGVVEPYDWIISTIPLPALWAMTGKSLPEEPLESRPIYVWTEEAEMLSYMQVNYVSDPTNPVYRITIRQGKRFFESLEPLTLPIGSERQVHRLMPGKIYSHNQTGPMRAELLQARVMTVGRYGAWNPEELAHETYAEVRDWKNRMDL